MGGTKSPHTMNHTVNHKAANKEDSGKSREPSQGSCRKSGKDG